MAGKVKKEYSELTKSRVDSVYGGGGDEPAKRIVNGTAGITVAGGARYSFDDIRRKMLDSIPFVKTVTLSDDVDFKSVDSADVKKLSTAMDRFVPRINCSCVVECVKARHFDQVKFFHAEMKDKLFPPRMQIDVGNVAPFSSVRINTGYIFKIPSRVQTINVENGGKLVKSKGLERQKEFVIVPHITCNQPDFVPTVYARDAEDTGLFTVNFSTLSGNVGTVYVVFKAYQIASPTDNVKLEDVQQSTKTVFKAKDQNSTRTVFNLKPKVRYETMKVVEKDACSFVTYDATQNRMIPYEKQRLSIRSVPTLFTSRKREWSDPRLMTLSGIFSPNSSGNNVCPKVAGGSVYKCNTHCVTFVEKRLNLFSVDARMTNDLKIFNGSFYDTPDYGHVSKAMRKATSVISSFGKTMSHCLSVASQHPELKVRDLIRYVDYHKSVASDPDVLRTMLMKTDRELYESRPTAADAYSVSLHGALSRLAAVYCLARTDKQIDATKTVDNTFAVTEASADGGDADHATTRTTDKEEEEEEDDHVSSRRNHDNGGEHEANEHDVEDHQRHHNHNNTNFTVDVKAVDTKSNTDVDDDVVRCATTIDDDDDVKPTEYSDISEDDDVVSECATATAEIRKKKDENGDVVDQHCEENDDHHAEKDIAHSESVADVNLLKRCATTEDSAAESCDVKKIKH